MLLFNYPRIPSKQGLIRPPSAPGEAQFMLECRRCKKCIEACEYGIIKQSGSEVGMGMGTPYLDFQKSYCRMCMKCVNACEHGVLGNMENNRKIGKARIDKKLCISWNNGICMTCHTYCSMTAIELDAELKPHVNDNCTGCGKCENLCMKHHSIEVKREVDSW